MSSANMHALKNCCLMQQPKPDEFNKHNKSSMHTENRAGLKTPPCLVPALRENFSEYAPPHLTTPKLLEYQHSIILMKKRGNVSSSILQTARACSTGRKLFRRRAHIN